MQEELSGLSPVLALIPGSMAVLTLMIVVLHIVVNREDIEGGRSFRRAFESWVKKLTDLLKNKS